MLWHGLWHWKTSYNCTEWVWFMVLNITYDSSYTMVNGDYKPIYHCVGWVFLGFHQPKYDYDLGRTLGSSQSVWVCWNRSTWVTWGFHAISTDMVDRDIEKKGRYQKDHEEIGSVILIRIQMGPASALFFDTLSGGPYSKVFVIQFDPPTTNPHYPCALQIESFLHAIPLSRTTGCSLTQDHGLSGSSLMNSW